MATRTITTLVDDIDGQVADETVTFSLDGVSFEIDLSTNNAAALRNTFAPWVEKGRRTGQPQPARRALKPVGDTRSALIRAWAAKHGMAVPARGRIPNDVQRQYDEAH